MMPQFLLEALPFGVLITDENLVVVQINQWLVDRLRLDASDFVNRPLARAFPELAERSLLAAYDLVRHEGRPLSLPMNLHRYFIRLPARGGTDLSEMPQSATIVPLYAGDRLTGTLTYIEDTTDGLLAERRLERENDKLTALHEIDRALATLDLQACLQIIVDRTRGLFQGENAALLLRTADQLTVAADSGNASSLVGRSVRVTDGLTGWAALHHEPIVIPDVHLDGRYLAIDSRARSEMAAPLMLRGDCLGVINVESRQANAFTERDAEMLEAIASRAAAAINNARQHATEREQRVLADTVRDIGLTLATELNPDAILDTLLDHVARVVPFDTASIMLLHAQGTRLHIDRHRGYDRFGVADLAAAFDLPLTGFANLGQMAETRRPAVIPDTRAHPNWIDTGLAAHIRSWAGAPIVSRSRVLGFLSLDKVEPGFYTPEMADHLAVFAAQAGLALDNAWLYATQQRLAVTDGLTGIANRRHFDQELTRELQRAVRFQRPTSLILLDLDDFKAFNDQFGHPAGDAVLRAIALVLSQSIRTIDTVARYGGEEFGIILPETDLPSACAAAERLRGVVAHLTRIPGALETGRLTRPVNLSLGVAVSPAHGKTAEALVRAADVALYRAKRAGKNRVAPYAP